MSEFKEGDEVQLKSGGPKMTVQEADFEEIYCQWFDNKQNVKEGRFLSKTLKPVITVKASIESVVKKKR